MAKARKQQQSEKIVAKAQDEITGQASELTETAIGDCDRVKEGFRPAYRTYLEAWKSLAEAFKRRERQDQEAYREAEQQYQIESVLGSMEIPYLSPFLFFHAIVK